MTVNIEEEIRDIAKTACEVMLTNAVHSAQLVLVGGGKSGVIGFEEFPENHDLKRKAMFGAGRQYYKSVGPGQVDRLYFITEGWMSKVSEGEEIPGGQPSKDPNRVEVLAVTGRHHKTGQTPMLIYEVLRLPDGELNDLLELHYEISDGESPLIDAFFMGYEFETLFPEFWQTLGEKDDE